MTLSPVMRIGAYDVLAKLGEGGMGEAAQGAGTMTVPGTHKEPS